MDLRIDSELGRLADAVRKAAGNLPERQRDLLTNLGLSLLEKSQFSYLDKSRGRRGEDGIVWKPLARATLEARVRRRSPAKRIVASRRKKAEQIKQAQREISDAGRGKDSANQRKRLRDKIARLRKQRAEQVDKLRKLIDQEVQNHEIGVDTGLQINSASPGYTAPDGRGGNILIADEAKVTVGYGREYSPYFDEDRPLFPERLPNEWIADLEQTAARFVEREVGRAFA